MENFFIDKLGNDATEDNNGGERNEVGKASHEEKDLLNEGELDLLDESLDSHKWRKASVPLKKKINLEDTYLITSYKTLCDEIKTNSDLDELLEKSTIKPGLEKQISCVPEKGKKLLKLERKKLRRKTKGKEWFDMPATELTKEVRNDFKLLKMRSVLDKKHFYKKNDITGVPKYFQIGKVVEGPADFYSGRIPKSERKKTFVDELLADAEFKKYQKKKFKEIMDESRRRKFTKNKKQSSAKGKSKKKLKG